MRSKDFKARRKNTHQTGIIFKTQFRQQHAQPFNLFPQGFTVAAQSSRPKIHSSGPKLTKLPANYGWQATTTLQFIHSLITCDISLQKHDTTLQRFATRSWIRIEFMLASTPRAREHGGV